MSKVVGGAPHSGGGGGESLSRDRAAQHYAAIVESSDDAILSKDLNGVITSWNSGAQRLFGYTAEEAVGRSVTIIIPTDRHDEEPMILERVRRGERIDHYETVRQRKDGSLIDISLTVSPIKDEKGEIVGASKIAPRHHTTQARPGATRAFAQGDGPSRQESVRTGDQRSEIERPLGRQRPGTYRVHERSPLGPRPSACLNSVVR